MNDMEIIEDTSGSGSNSGDNRKRVAEVIELYPTEANTGTRHIDNTIDYKTTSRRRSKQYRIRKDFRDNISFDQIRKKADKELMTDSYHLIVDALDREIDRIERSNLFDGWKDSLETIMAEVRNVSVNHRKILGAIIVATKGKDIADFATEELNMLRDGTYMLRQLRVISNDSKRIIKRLIAIGADMAIPLATDDMSDKHEKSMDQLMNSLIKRSK